MSECEGKHTNMVWVVKQLASLYAYVHYKLYFDDPVPKVNLRNFVYGIENGLLESVCQFLECFDGILHLLSHFLVLKGLVIRYIVGQLSV